MSQFYGDDVNKANLKCQLQTFALDYPKENTPPNIFDITEYMRIRSLSPVKEQLIAEVCTVLKLILVMPVSNTTSEHSFSALRRVKTYLRSTMRQDRLNHLMILHVHKELTGRSLILSTLNFDPCSLGRYNGVHYLRCETLQQSLL